MNEEGKILYATFLPIVVLVAVLAGTGYFLLKGDIKLPKLRKEPTEIRRLEGFPTIASDTNELDKKRLIIKSQDELNNFLNEIDPAARIILKEDINFDKEYLIAATTETKDMYGYEMKVRKVKEDKNGKFVVELQEETPGDYCEDEFDKVPNIAVDIVAISKTDSEFDFERIKDVKDCDAPEDMEDMQKNQMKDNEDKVEDDKVSE